MQCRVFEYRKAAGLSQAELSRIAGVDQKTISNYENGGDMKVSYAVRIADALGVPPLDLIGIEKPAQKTMFPDDSKMAGYWDALNNVGRARLLEYARMLTQIPENVSSKSRGLHPLAG